MLIAVYYRLTGGGAGAAAGPPASPHLDPIRVSACVFEKFRHGCRSQQAALSVIVTPVVVYTEVQTTTQSPTSSVEALVVVETTKYGQVFLSKGLN